MARLRRSDYCPERSHFRFRWWYEYSGGIATDWGAHHMDVAQWALNVEDSGPLTIDGTATKLPTIPGGFNTPKLVTVDYLYPGDVQVQMLAQPPGDEGVLFEGEKGRMFVNRGRITGKAIEEQDADPKLKEKVMADVEKLYKGNTAKMGDHMGNFFEAWKFGKWPISDVEQPASLGERLPPGQPVHPAETQAHLGRGQGSNLSATARPTAMLSRPQRDEYACPTLREPPKRVTICPRARERAALGLSC